MQTILFSPSASWLALSERDQLLSEISDASKEAQGFRARHHGGNGETVEELREILQRYYRYAREDRDQERENAERAERARMEREARETERTQAFNASLSLAARWP